MKLRRVFSIFMSTVMIFSLTNQYVYASDKDYRDIYLEFGQNASLSDSNPLNDGVGAAVMMDFNNDGTPELLTFRTYVIHMDNNGRIVASGEEGYDIAPVKKREYSLYKGFYISNGIVCESSPWVNGDYSAPIGMRFLPGESGSGNEFTGTYKSTAGENTLAMYHIPIVGMPAYTAISFDGSGFRYYTNTEKEEFFKIYTEENIKVASANFFDDSGKKISVYDGMKLLTEQYSGGAVKLIEHVEAFKVSDWAQSEVLKAKSLNLLPYELSESDLTKNITRAEFAAVAMKVYEAISNKDYNKIAGKIGDISGNPFESYIKRAFKLGITSGMGTDSNGNVIFSPDTNITREQLATMLCRIIKLTSFGEMYYEDGADLSLDISGAPVFDDAHMISGYAQESVSYMSKHGIIKGVDSSNFAPKSTATREQAILLALRIVDNSDKLISY